MGQDKQPAARPSTAALDRAPTHKYWVAEHVTSQEGHDRLLWLFPIGPGMGIVFALTGRFCGQLLRSVPLWRRV